MLSCTAIHSLAPRIRERLSRQVVGGEAKVFVTVESAKRVAERDAATDALGEYKRPVAFRTVSGSAGSRDNLTGTVAGILPANEQRIRRWALSYRDISRSVALFDILIILATATVSGVAYHYVAYGAAMEATRNVAVSVFVAIFFVFLTHLRKCYDPPVLLIWKDQLQSVTLIWSCAFIFLGGVVFSLGVSKEASRGAILWFAVSGVVGLLLSRLVWRAFIERTLAAGSLARRNVVVIDWDFRAATSHFAMDLERHGFQVARHFTIGDLSQTAMDDCLARAVSFVRGSDIQEIYLLSRPDRLDGIREAVERLRVLPIPVTLIPNAATSELVRQPWHQIGHSIAIELQRPPLSTAERAFKRAFDILTASCGLVMFMPLLALVALAIKIDSPGPILFKQTRHGFNGKAFKICKFRSMSVLDDGTTIKQATLADSRVTRVGALIRKTSIDEIPQLINVLRGEMSVIGPRPHAVAHDDYYLKQIDKYAFRHHVKPGITGWAQVHGLRGETRTLDKMLQRVEYDLWYINNWSFWLDLVIILRTLGEVVRGENAY
jgi:Undecaprenyl-phosphate glucose phosphotransferase